MTKELLIYADESASKGKHFSNFYGGALVRSDDITSVEAMLNQAKVDQNMFGEIKWSRVTGQYLEKYKTVMDLFFDLVANDRVKLRIMFTDNAIPFNFPTETQQSLYFSLYYEFIRNAFGLQYSNRTDEPLHVRILFDKLPDQRVSSKQFKEIIRNMQYLPTFKQANIRLREDAIAEVDSKRHVVLQCMDVVLGCMHFWLNRLHEPQSPNAHLGNRTIAKADLFTHIHGHIQTIHSPFNPMITTELYGDTTNRWKQPYRHWVLIV